MTSHEAITYLRDRGFDIGSVVDDVCGDGDCGHLPLFTVDNVPLCSRHLIDTCTIVKGWATQADPPL